MMNKQILFFILLSIFVGHAKAQQSLSAASITTGTSKTGNGKIYRATNRENEAARAIEFNARTVKTSNFLANINQYFNIPAEFTFVEAETNTDNLGMQHHLMQQYYEGIPLEGLAYRVHEKNGFVTSANGKAVRKVNVDLNTVLSERQAFDLALQYLQSKDSVFRRGKKLIVSKDFTFAPESFSVAFQFDIDVSLIERWRISIDAKTGEVINKISLVQSCLDPPSPEYGTGTGMTNYYGPQTIRVRKSDDGSSRSIGQTENGVVIGTYDFENRSTLLWAFGLFKPRLFYSADNAYYSTYQQPGVSVQWAAEQTYEYYFGKHNRNSFDNDGGTITSYVHVEKDWENASWTGKVLLFGDGIDNNPLVELDVVSHELTHAVTQYEAGLTYFRESGSLNESFSDIFAKAVEFSTFGDTATWQIARHHQAGGIRDMNNPNLKGQPDTYVGDKWYSGYEDNGGVHINSGVQNFWYYLLCEGGSGVNDLDIAYSVNAIGMDIATNIVYRNLTEYLISSSDYLDCRIGSLLAAADLYGNNSSAYQEVEKAWDAVGVIDEPIITSFDLYDITATTVKLKGSLLPRGDSVTYHFEYGTTAAYDKSTATYKYTDAVEGIITGLLSKTKYYVRLVATNENGDSYAATEFTTLSLAPLVKIKHTVDVTDTSAILHGEVNPNSRPTSFYFKYGPTSAMGSTTPSYSLSDTTEYLNVSARVTDLQPRQIYYYKLVATNDFASSETDSVNFFTAVKPIINSFMPIVATPGSEITITGQNFNQVSEKNVISFGATRGTVISSSPTELRVQVPSGASFGPISVLDTESALITESTQEFVPTFSDEFGNGDMQLRAAFDEIQVREIAISDIDGDGKPDIVVSRSDGFTFFQNVNSGGDITNESFVQSNIAVNDFFGYKGLADIDGNGLEDIVISLGGDKVRIYPNFSVPGYIFFGVPVDLLIGSWDNLQMKDFDNDGHIDIAGIGDLPGEQSLFAIFRNENPKGTLSSDSFEKRYSQILPYSDIYFLNSGDLNNDGSTDLIASAYRKDFFSILKNKSYPGVFDFEEIVIPDSIRERYAKYSAQDLNQDGWKDITSFSFYDTEKMAIFENNGPNINLSGPIVGLDGYFERSIQPADIDGDGKVDLTVGDYDGRFILLKNKTETDGHLSDSSFQVNGQFGINENKTHEHEVSSDVLVNDLNGDGRPEVINNLSYNFYPYKGHQLEIWQNAPNDCFDPSLISVKASKKSATVLLPPNTTLEDFEIEYVYGSGTNWIQASSTTLSHLYSGALYHLRARAKCYLGFTDYYYTDFTTECVDLSSFSISDIQIDEVSLNASLSSFEIQYSEAGKDEWKNVSGWSSKIYNLLPGTTYDLRYRGQCDILGEFNYMQFTTLCPTLSALDVSEITYNKAVVNWTSDYDGTAVLEYSADNINWMVIDQTQTMFPLIPGKEYFVRGVLACTNSSSDYIYTSFTTPCPKVSMLAVDAVTPFGADVSWMDESHTDSYAIKYSVSGNKIKTTETTSTSFHLDGLDPGTQYTISVAPKCFSTEDFSSTSFTTVCYAPFNLTAKATTYTTAELVWDDHYSGPPYFIDYAIDGSNAWQTVESTSRNALLDNLRPGTKYEARVHINCLNETAPYASVFFETSLYGETVYAPNPTDNIVTIYPSKDLIGHEFGIYDESGRRVAGGKLSNYHFDFSELSAGTYILKIDGEEPMKIIKR